MNPPTLFAWRRLAGAVAVVAAFVFGIHADRLGCFPQSSRLPPRDVQTTFEPFWEAWDLARAHHVNGRSIADAEMTQGAVRGLLDSLGDRGHTTYLSADQVKKFRDSLDGLQDGIGVSVRRQGDRLSVVDVMARSPARAAGLREGDAILTLDGEDVTRLPLDDLQRRLHGPAGTIVRLRVVHATGGPTVDLPIVREPCESPVVTWQIVPGQPMAHIAIRSFARPAEEQLREALRVTEEKGAHGIILDLRGNPGGFRDQAIATASAFLGEGPVMFEFDRRGRRRAIPVRGSGATDRPLVVLIDSNTASAAEIVAAALKDHARATLVGTRTFGTGTVLQPFPLSDGSAVLLAVARWQPPGGQPIWHKGLRPHVEVPRLPGVPPFQPEANLERDAATFGRRADPQLLEAIASLRARMSARDGYEQK